MEFYPRNAAAPVERRTQRLFLRPLRASDVELDYDAVMSSAEMLRRWSQSGWPADDFTLAQNLDDLRRHEREHEERQAFTFTVLDPPGTRCLGCVYLTPLRPEAAALCEGAAHAATVREKPMLFIGWPFVKVPYVLKAAYETKNTKGKRHTSPHTPLHKPEVAERSQGKS